MKTLILKIRLYFKQRKTASERRKLKRFYNDKLTWCFNELEAIDTVDLDCPYAVAIREQIDIISKENEALTLTA
jgi:hypothetical protein